LDPDTGKPSEGFHITFRPVALPIRSEDYVHPYAPWGPAGPPNRVRKDPPTDAPVDPKESNSKETELTQEAIDQANSKAGANIRAFVNTFFLVDQKLRFNDDWTPYPGATSIHRTWYAIVHGATATLELSELSENLEKKYADALSVLQEKNENGVFVPTQKALAYDQYRAELASHIRARDKFYAELKEEGRIDDFGVEGIPYIESIRLAEKKLEAFGYAVEVTQAYKVNTPLSA